MDCRLDSNKEDRVGLLSYSSSEAAENPSELNSACSQAELTDGSSSSNKQAQSNEAHLSDVPAAERLLKEPCIEAGFYGAPSLSEGHHLPLEHPLSSNELADVVTLKQLPCSVEDPDRIAQEPELSDDVKREMITEICKGVSILSCGSEAPGGSCHVYLIGTAHVSEESCREVQAAVHLLKPQVVFLELCQKRTSVLQRTPFVVPTMSDMILSWKQRKTNMLGIVYSWFLAKVAAKLDVRPGAEFRAAYEEALACGAKVVLGDRDVEVTLRRTWAKMTLWYKTKFIFVLLYQSIFLPKADQLNELSGKSIAMDFIFDLPRTQNGHDSIWTFIDRFSKQAHFVPVKKTVKPDHLARLFVAQIFRLHGMPETIVSDRDPRFTSLFWKAIWENIGMWLQFSSSFHPQTDGQSEIANSVVLDLLKSYISESEDSMGKKSQERQKKAADLHRRDSKLKENDWVLLRFDKARLRQKKGKEELSMRYYGPFQITEQINDTSFRLRLPDTWKIHNVFHVNLWKTFGDVPDDGEPDEQPEVEANEEILVPEQELKDEMTAAFWSE
ncbi:hypothetical protein L7F22_045698 [Adiantum nelumboides]|nr:hypothetical protein [Adiantum nelumboides]